MDEVERAREEPVRVRTGGWGVLGGTVEMGDWAVSADATMGCASVSCHCRCRITDLVAHVIWVPFAANHLR